MLVAEKLKQASAVLQECGLDSWLTYVRETIEMKDPAMHFVSGRDVVWEAAFLVTASGKTYAILGQGDHEDFAKAGLYDEIITYVQDFGEPLRELLGRIDPQSIAINYSLDNPGADGLSLGMYKKLLDYLQGTPFADRFVSSDPVIQRVRGRKTVSEVQRIRTAAQETLNMFGILTQCIQPDWTLRRISRFMHDLMIEEGVEASWSWEGDPGITCGGAMEGGHATPDDTKMQPGDVLRLDFGIKKDGYSSDLQRTWYILRAGETEAPEEVTRAFKTVREGIEAAAEILRPGILGWQVDAAAREVLDRHGYPQYQHALGHQVGIWAHDGGSVLGPRWPRYGQLPYQPIEAQQVYTLEFGIQTSVGYVSQEDMVLVTDSGCEFLVPPQRDLWLLRF